MSVCMIEFDTSKNYNNNYITLHHSNDVFTYNNLSYKHVTYFIEPLKPLYVLFYCKQLSDVVQK